MSKGDEDKAKDNECNRKGLQVGEKKGAEGIKAVKYNSQT